MKQNPSLSKQAKSGGIQKNNNMKSADLSLMKKTFRESPVVEKFYKTIYEYRLREETYKTAIKIYLDLKK